MGMLARLGVVLGLDSGEFKQGLESADRSLSNFSSKVGTVGTVAAAAFAAMTYKSLAYADSIADVAKANDMAIKSVMALSEGLAQNGGNADSAGKLISSFTAQVDSAAQGSKEAQEAFTRLGVSFKDLANKDVTELFDQTIEALAKMEDPLSRNALAMTMFGKAAKGVDFVGLAEGTAEARKEFEQYADAVKFAADLNDKLEAKVTKTIVLFNTAFLPSLNALFDALVRDAKGMDALMEAATSAGKFIAGSEELDELVKNLADNQMRQAALMGASSATDQARQVVALANGSENITAGALAQIVQRADATSTALEKFNKGLNKYFEKSGAYNGPIHARNFKQTWADNYDPRIFMVQNVNSSDMSPAEKQAQLQLILKGTSEQERKDLAKKAEIIKRLERGDF